MAESIGTTALIITADTAGLTSGIASAKQQYRGFVGDTQQAGKDLSASFSSARDKIGEVFANVKAGKFGEAFLGVKAIATDVGSALSGIGSAATSSLASLSALAAAGGLMAGLSVAARGVTKDLNELNKLSQRIGSNTGDTQVILRAFKQAGIEDAEHTLTRFFDRLGDVRRDAAGPTAQALRQLRLDPNALLRGSPLQAIEQVVVALGQVGNVYDRAALSQAIFGKGFHEVQELVRQGRGGFERATRIAELTGDSEGVIRQAVQAEAKWREVGDRVSIVWGVIKRGARAALTDISADLATLALNTAEAFDLSPIMARNSRASRDAVESFANLTGALTPGTGPVDRAIANASPAGLAARRRAQQQLQDLLNQNPATVALQMRIESLLPTAAEIVASARGVGQAVSLALSRGFQSRDIRSEGVAAGLIPPDAIASEVDALRPLLDMRRQLQTSAGAAVTVPLFDAASRLIVAQEASRNVTNLTAQWNREAENVGRTQHQIDLALIERERSLGRISDLEAEIARGARLDLEIRRQQRQELDRQRDEARQVTDRTRTPLEQFQAETARLAGNPFLSAQARDRDLVARFNQLAAGLGSGPSNFAPTAPTIGTLEGARFLADLQIRQRGGLDDPQQRVARVMDAIRRIEEQNGTRLDTIATEIRNQTRPAPAPAIN